MKTMEDAVLVRKMSYIINLACARSRDTIKKIHVLSASLCKTMKNRITIKTRRARSDNRWMFSVLPSKAPDSILASDSAPEALTSC